MAIAHGNQAKIPRYHGKVVVEVEWEQRFAQNPPPLANYSELFPCRDTVHILCVIAEPDHSIAGPIS